MLRRTPMKRTAWPRKSGPRHHHAQEIERNMPIALMEFAQVAIKKIVKSTAKMAKPGGFTTTVAHPKTEAARSEPYRRLVAALPCKACGIQGYSQAAHVPPDGKGVKQDDREIFALCCTRVGITGCHVEFDQYRMFPREEAVRIGKGWAAHTRRQITEKGQWPKNLPKWTEE